MDAIEQAGPTVRIDCCGPDRTTKFANLVNIPWSETSLFHTKASLSNRKTALKRSCALRKAYRWENFVDLAEVHGFDALNACPSCSSCIELGPGLETILDVTGGFGSTASSPRRSPFSASHRDLGEAKFRPRPRAVGSWFPSHILSIFLQHGTHKLGW